MKLVLTAEDITQAVEDWLLEHYTGMVKGKRATIYIAIKGGEPSIEVDVS